MVTFEHVAEGGIEVGSPAAVEAHERIEPARQPADDEEGQPR
jgi:hypothetical protein